MRPVEMMLAEKAIRERRSLGTIRQQAAWSIGQFINCSSPALPFSRVFHIGGLRYYLKLRVG